MTPNSYTHRLARKMVRPLVATRITANHLTAARLIVGLAACLALATGLRTWELWGGFLWVLSAFLDRADGELARLSGKTSITGHRFDFLSDVIVNGIVFVAIGVGQREGILGIHAITLGIIAGTSIVLACIWSERLEQLNDNREKAYAGWRGSILMMFCISLDLLPGWGGCCLFLSVLLWAVLRLPRSPGFA